MRKTAIFTSALAIASFVMILSSCNKNKEYDITSPGSYAHFNGAKFQSYQMSTATPPVYNVEVGTTDVSAQDRTVTVNVSSPSGAVKGTHYNLSLTGNTITIPAGQAIVNIPVQGIYAPYTSGRKDTLVFTLAAPSIGPAPFSDTVKLILRGPCFDGDINPTVLTSLMGTYANSKDVTPYAYGPYTTTLKTPTVLTPTTARIVINNVWADGWGDIPFILDWTNSTNTTIDVDGAVVTGGDAGSINSTYAGMKVVVRSHPTPGTASKKFSACNQNFNLVYQCGVYNPATSAVLGYFTNVFTSTIAR